MLLDAADPLTSSRKDGKTVSKRKHASLQLNVHRVNTAAQQFYVRMGLKEIGADPTDSTILIMERRGK
jgi:hypothetical protein